MSDDFELLNTLQDLPGIESFEPMASSRELLKQIDEYLKEINDIRDQNQGFTRDLVDRITQQFLADRVRHSATIEGSTLDREPAEVSSCN